MQQQLQHTVMLCSQLSWDAMRTGQPAFRSQYNDVDCKFLLSAALLTSGMCPATRQSLNATATAAHSHVVLSAILGRDAHWSTRISQPVH